MRKRIISTLFVHLIQAQKRGDEVESRARRDELRAVLLGCEDSRYLLKTEEMENFLKYAINVRRQGEEICINHMRNQGFGFCAKLFLCALC